MIQPKLQAVRVSREKAETRPCLEIFMGKGFFLSQKAEKSLNIIREVKMTLIVCNRWYLNYTHMDT
ncbi:MAG: hypothetical protein GTN76_02565 [Candidatus Aenigmarchaeota archaeon]|nr:hypothetical protein [Candidatus Aenigmarchaeota archaeon]